MRLLLEAIINQPEGIIDVSVIIKNDDGKKRSYTYHVTSDRALKQFNGLYYQGEKCHGKALQVLVKNSVPVY